jgi:hypothetical protein
MNNPLSGTDPTGYAACAADITDGTVCEATVTKEVTDKKTGEIKTEKKTYTVANNGGNLFIAEGAGKSAQKAVLGAINDFGGASKRNNIAGFHAPRMGIETSSAGGPSRDAMAGLPEARLYNMDTPEKPNAVTNYVGDVMGAWGARFSGESGYAHNYFTGDVISNPVAVRTWSFINVATLLLPTKASSGSLTAEINPSLVRFSQDSVRNTFKAGGTIEELAIGLRSGTIKAGDIPTVRLVGKNGELYTLDNRRLLAFQQAGIKMPYRMATPAEAAKDAFKFTTKNDGTSIVIRK